MSLSPVQYFVVCSSQSAETANEKENKYDKQKCVAFVDSVSQWKNLQNIYLTQSEIKLYNVF